FAAIGRDRDRGARVLGNRHVDVAGVADEAIAAAVQDRTDETDRAADRPGLDHARLHAVEHHVAVHRLGADLALGIGDVDVVIDRGALEPASCARHHQAALPRAGLDATLATL